MSSQQTSFFCRFKPYPSIIVKVPNSIASTTIPYVNAYIQENTTLEKVHQESILKKRYILWEG